MGLSLVLQLVTLNDLEPRNGRYVALFPNSVPLGPITSHSLKFDSCCLQQKRSPKNLRFESI